MNEHPSKRRTADWIIIIALAAAATVASGAMVARASETITYNYNARGELNQVAHSGTPAINNGVATTYSYDKAGNRTNKTTTGSSNPPPP